MTQTIQGFLDAMSSEERDIQAIVVAAAVEGVELDDQEITDKYNALPETNKHLIDFIVGHALAEDSPVEHTDIYHSELAHYGVKGMRWGIRKDDSGGSSRPAARKSASPEAIDQKAKIQRARAKIKAGEGTLGDAHTAALKTSGHRITNAVLGDKTFWKRNLKIAGAYTAGMTASLVGPFLLPVDLVASVGGSTSAATQDLGWGIGYQLLAGTGMLVTTAASEVAVGVNYANNAWRAATGNARIRRSAENLGRLMKQRQNEGSKQVQKVLVRNGSLKKRHVRNPRVKHTAMEEYTLEGTLAHYGVKGMRWGTVRRKLKTNSEVRQAQKVLAGKKPTSGYSDRELRSIQRKGSRKTYGQRARRRLKQSAILAIGAAVVKEYLDINGDVTTMEDIERQRAERGPDPYEDSWRKDYPKERNGPMFNPDATLDPSQVEIR